jgi:polysaccharide biosynthesis protein PelC
MTAELRIRTLVMMIAIVALAGCGGTTSFLSPEADLPFYERVGIVPFTGLSQDRAAGYRVSDVFFSKLLRRGFAEVVEPGQFSAAMSKARAGVAPETPWSAADLAKLGQEAGVQGVFMGTVREYDMTRTARDAFPLLSLEVRLVDVASGQIVWSASDTRRGGPGFPIWTWFSGLFGGGEIHTMGELTTEMCRELLGTLPRN